MVDSSRLTTGGPAHSNAETASYQELIAREDELVDAIHCMILVSTDPNIENLLAPHISPRIHDQPKISMASVELPEVDENTAPRWAKLGAFIPQKKERRKESYAIR
jgi:hypothetical protein